MARRISCFNRSVPRRPLRRRMRRAHYLAPARANPDAALSRAGSGRRLARRVGVLLIAPDDLLRRARLPYGLPHRAQDRRSLPSLAGTLSFLGSGLLSTVGIDNALEPLVELAGEGRHLPCMYATIALAFSRTRDSNPIPKIRWECVGNALSPLFRLVRQKVGICLARVQNAWKHACNALSPSHTQADLFVYATSFPIPRTRMLRQFASCGVMESCERRHIFSGTVDPHASELWSHASGTTPP